MFDPYHTWLGMPRSKRPPTYYQLLGITANETDRRLIQEAAIRRISQIRIYQAGPYEQECVRLLNEVVEAETTLLDPARRKAYDAQLDQGATQERKRPCRTVSRQEPAIRYPALEKRLAVPATPIAAGTSPFEELVEPGPIIEFRTPPCFVPPQPEESLAVDAGIVFSFAETGSRYYRQRTNRRFRLDPLALVYLGFLILAAVLGFWLGRL
jgi:hypothetical protein